MTGYKTSISQRLNLSEGKMGGGSSLCDRLRWQIMQCLQHIFSLEESENLKKSVYARDKAENKYRPRTVEQLKSNIKQE